MFGGLWRWFWGFSSSGTATATRPMRVFRITGRAECKFTVSGASGRVFPVAGAGE